MTNNYDPIYLDGQALPLYGNLREITTPMAAENITLDGTLYVDYQNHRRSWEIGWNYLTQAQYDQIRSAFNKQYSEQRMLQFYVPGLDIDVFVHIKIEDKEIKYNGQLVQDFKITLEEQDAIS